MEELDKLRIENQSLKSVLSDIQRWLKDGATISAVYPDKLAIKISEDGILVTGLRVTYPKRKE